MAELALRARLKIVWSHDHVGSTPTSGTKMPRQKTPAKEFVWTPKLAYVVGLLVTDGNLSKDGRHITMRSSDKCMLVTFKKCLRLENKIGESYDKGKEKPPSYRVQFCNIQFYKWLIFIGVRPAKTHTISKIKIPEKFL